MIIQQKIGNLNNADQLNRKVDWLELEWFEANKRILRKTTNAGTEIVFRSLDKDPEFTDGDILFADDKTIVAVKILPCEVIVIKPASMFEMASACYEIGNKHAPLFYEEDELLVPFEFPLLRSLQAFGFDVKQEQRKLLQRLKTTVAAHALINSNTIITKLTKQTTDE
jgi:urease accessory protein